MNTEVTNLFRRTVGGLGEAVEARIINEILASDIIKDKKIERNIAYYACALADEKGELVRAILQSLWKKTLIPDMFIEFQKFDQLLTLAGKRRHFIHQFQVYILGMHLVLAHSNLSLSSTNKGLEKKKEFLTSWLLAATSHDLGYPVSECKQIMKLLSNLFGGYKLSLSHEYFRIITEEAENLLEKDLIEQTNKAINASNTGVIVNRVLIDSLIDILGISETDSNRIINQMREEKNHGYISGVLLCNRVAELLENRDIDGLDAVKDVYEVVKNAVGAVLIHSLHQVDGGDKWIEKIEWDRNAVSWLLFVVDNLQDWGRNAPGDGEWPKYLLSDYKKLVGGFEIDYVVWHGHWDDKTKETVKKYIDEKARLLSKVSKSRVPETGGLRLRVCFESNGGEDLGTVDLIM